MDKRDFKFKWKLRFAGMAVVFVAAVGLVVMLLWNWLMPQLFALPEISYFQAVGLLLLSKILLGGFGKGPRSHHRHPYWRWKYKQKWQNMTDVEKEEFKKRMNPES